MKTAAESFHCNRFHGIHRREMPVNRSGNRETLQGWQLRPFTFSREIHAAFTSQEKEKKPYKPFSLLAFFSPGSLVFTFSRRIAGGCVPHARNQGDTKNSRSKSCVMQEEKS